MMWTDFMHLQKTTFLLKIIAQIAQEIEVSSEKNSIFANAICFFGGSQDCCTWLTHLYLLRIPCFLPNYPFI